jgi:hypothetical protein
MIRIFIILCLLTFMGCNRNTPKYVETFRFPYSENELNLILAMDFIKIKHKKCKGECVFTVNSHFYHFDTCANAFLSHLKLKKPVLHETIKVPEGIYYIENFGTIKVYHHKDDEKPDFIFSPLYYDTKDNEIHGQLKYKDGRRETFNFDVVNNTFYNLVPLYYYGHNCSWDTESY